MTEMTEIAFERLVIEELKKSGYPADTIIPEWKNKNSRVDIAVMDKETQIPLMFIECKVHFNPSSLDMALNQLRRNSATLNYPIRACVAGYTGGQQFEFYDFTKKLNDDEIPISECGPTNLPSYDEIRTGAESKYISAQKKQKRRYINGLKVFCWAIIPAIIIALFIFDLYSIYPLTSERLILLGILILSLLLPFFGEIKVGEVTLSNKKKDEEK